MAAMPPGACIPPHHDNGQWPNIVPCRPRMRERDVWGIITSLLHRQASGSRTPTGCTSRSGPTRWGKTAGTLNKRPVHFFSTLKRAGPPLCAHTAHCTQEAGPFSVARLKMDLPFHNRIAYFSCVSCSQEKRQPSWWGHRCLVPGVAIPMRERTRRALEAHQILCFKNHLSHEPWSLPLPLPLTARVTVRGRASAAPHLAHRNQTRPHVLTRGRSNRRAHSGAPRPLPLLQGVNFWAGPVYSQMRRCALVCHHTDSFCCRLQRPLPGRCSSMYIWIHRPVLYIDRLDDEMGGQNHSPLALSLLPLPTHAGSF